MDIKISVINPLKFVLFFLLITGNLFSQWSQDVRLTNDPSDSHQQLGSARWIAVRGNTVHVIWIDKRDGFPQLYYKRSTDGGINWSQDLRLTNDTFNVSTATIAVWGDTVHVAWSDDRDGDYDIYYKRSIDGGLTWQTDTCLVNDNIYSQRPALAVWKNYVYLAYSVYYYPNYIRFKRSIDGGVTWENEIDISNGVPAWCPSIFAVDSFVHISWHDGGAFVLYRHSSNYGVDWDSVVVINTPSGQLSEATCITVSDSNIHIIWHDDAGGGQLFYARSTDNGNTWGQPVILSSYFSGVVASSIISSDSNVYAVWNSDHTGHLQIYYKYSHDNGLTWSQDTQLTYDTTNSSLPNLAFSDSVLYLVWTDSRDGNREIYFKRNPYPEFMGETTPRPHLKKEQETVKLFRIMTFFDDNLNLTFLNSYKKPIHLNLYSTSGRVVIKKLFLFIPKKLTIRTANLPPGVYFLNIEIDRKYRLKEKLIKR